MRRTGKPPGPINAKGNPQTENLITRMKFYIFKSLVIGKVFLW